MADRQSAIDVRLADGPFDPYSELASFGNRYACAGALVHFLGVTRPAGGVLELELSHYPPMTERDMRTLAARTFNRFALDGLLMLHRTGRMVPGEPIVLVAAAAQHRRAGFDGVDYAMDHLKCAAWFWKRERKGAGWRWVEPRPADRADLARWYEKTGGI